MTKDQEKVIALVQLQIEPDETVDEGKIKELVEFFRNLIYLSEEEAAETRGCGRFLGPELSNSKTASILHRTQTT